MAMVDFNYLDAAGRHRVADAVETLAETPGEHGEVYKIYGLTQQMRMMTDGFTRDPEALRAVAENIRNTAWREAPAGEDVPVDPVARADAEDRRASGVSPAPSGAAIGLSDLPGGGQEGNVSFARVGGADALQLEALGAPSEVFDYISQYNAIASVSSIEAVMRAHTFIPGRKIIVLFTTEAFRIPGDSRRQDHLQGIEELARQGFAIWTVEVAGLANRNSGRSELISALAQDTGGSTVRKTGRLERAFEGAREQISCYYLFSLPVSAQPGRDDKVLLTVKLNTDKYPNLWGMRVFAPDQITVPSRRKQLESERVSALLSPEDFNHPRVGVTLDYPVDMDGKQVLPIRLRVPLTELTWERTEAGGPARARLLVDAVAERATARGRSAFCSIGSDTVGTLEMELPAPPTESTRAALSVELPCPLGERGLLTARGTITDLADDRVGGGRSTVFVGKRRPDTWEVVEPRVEAVSGRDFWWYPGAESAVKDRGRRAWRALGEGDAAHAAPDDRIAVSFVLCGPERDRATRDVRTSLIRLKPDGTGELFRAFSESAYTFGDGNPGRSGAFCSLVRVAVPEYTLMPGRYAFVVYRQGVPPEALTAATEPEAVYSKLPFEVH